MGGSRGSSGEKSRTATAAAGVAEVALPVCPRPDRGIRPQAGVRNPDRQIAVLIPELVEAHWHNYLIHNQRAQWLKALLLIKGDRRIVVINVPWYLDREEPRR